MTSAPRCMEEDCDRPASLDDARCALHASRLGPVPRSPEFVRITEPGAVLDVATPLVPATQSASHYPRRIGITWAGVAVLAASTAAGAADALHLVYLDKLWLLVALTGGLASSVATPLWGWAALRAADTAARRRLAQVGILLGLSPWALVLLVLILTATAVID